VFPAPKGKYRSKVHPSIDRGHVNNDEMERDTRVSKPNVMGSRVVMMRDAHAFRCIDVEGSNRGYMSYVDPFFSTLLHFPFAFS